MDSRTNGALLLLLRRLVAGRTRPVEILRFVVARKNPEDWLKEEGRGREGGMARDESDGDVWIRDATAYV